MLERNTEKADVVFSHRPSDFVLPDAAVTGGVSWLLRDDVAVRLSGVWQGERSRRSICSSFAARAAVSSPNVTRSLRFALRTCCNSCRVFHNSVEEKASAKQMISANPL